MSLSSNKNIGLSRLSGKLKHQIFSPKLITNANLAWFLFLFFEFGTEEGKEKRKFNDK